MAQPQIFTDEDIKRIIQEASISDDEKKRLIAVIPGMDQRKRALLSLNLMLQEGMNKDVQISSLREKYHDDPQKLKEELGKIELDDQKIQEERIKRSKLEELRTTLKNNPSG